MRLTNLLQRWLGEDLNNERGGDTWLLRYGDLARWSENEAGYREGARISFDVGFGDHTGQFDIEGEWKHVEIDGMKIGRKEWVRANPTRIFLTHWIIIQLGRWGVSLEWRGREITGTDWGKPRWWFDRNGKLLPEYAD